MLRKMQLTLTGLLALALLAACAPEASTTTLAPQASTSLPAAAAPEPMPEADTTQYATLPSPLPSGGEVFLLDRYKPHRLVDREGNLLAEADSISLVYSQTGSGAQCYVAERIPTTYSPEEYFAAAARRESAVYSLSGELLLDWAVQTYEGGVGDWLCAYNLKPLDEGYWFELENTCLINMHTGERKLESYSTIISTWDWGIYPMRPDSLILGSDWETPTALVDATGEIILGDPWPEGLGITISMDGYLMAQMPHENYFTAWQLRSTQSGNPLLVEGAYHRIYPLGDVVVLANMPDETPMLTLYDPEQAKVTLRAELTTDYAWETALAFDGTVLATDNALYTADGMLAGPYHSLALLDEDAGAAYLAYDDEAAYLLDEKGRVLHSYPGDGGIRYLGCGRYIYASPTDKNNEQQNTLLGKELEPLAVLPGYVYTWRDAEESSLHFLAVVTDDGEKLYYSLDGEPYPPGAILLDRQIVQQGRYYGLMDGDGNWIYKINIYASQLND